MKRLSRILALASSVIWGRRLDRGGSGREGRGWISTRGRRGWADGLQGHPVRGAAGRRPPLARPSAGGEMGRREEASSSLPRAGRVMGPEAGPGASEDCLYLNVWTPAKSPRDRSPFSCGSTVADSRWARRPIPFGGEKLAKGVVLVSIAYRVGQMGFFAHPELSAETKHRVSGNYGLLDMIAGLQWVGETSPHSAAILKVTIFGESAGGIAVSMLCASPLAKGLFHGAISQSGGSFGPPRPEPCRGRT